MNKILYNAMGSASAIVSTLSSLATNVWGSSELPVGYTDMKGIPRVKDRSELVKDLRLFQSCLNDALDRLEAEINND